MNCIMELSSFLNLPDNIITKISSFLNIKELINILSVSKQIRKINVWDEVAEAQHIKSDTCIVCLSDFKKALFKSKCICESDLHIDWGHTPVYWERNVLLNTADSLNYPCAQLNMVWWLNICCTFSSVKSGKHNVFMKVGCLHNRINLGKLNCVITNENDLQINAPEGYINTQKFQDSPTGWYWIHLGRIEKDPGQIKIRVFDTNQTVKGPALISHIEVIPTSEITAEQKLAIKHNWSCITKNILF